MKGFKVRPKKYSFDGGLGKDKAKVMDFNQLRGGGEPGKK